MTAEMSEHIQMLTNIEVTDRAFERILETMVPMPPNGAKMAESRATNKRDVLRDMYENDPRVAPWKGSGLGVVQAFSTFKHHKAGTDKNRIERNMIATLDGTGAQSDKRILTLLGV
jgi:hypothetical protein